jgi:adenosyl cobinamide kinase/adenosyl cobinamide phosphate guanylyltransferase
MKVIIGNSTYDVKLDGKIIEDKYVGQANYFDKEIKLYDRMNKESKGQSLWHEIVHVILDEMGEEDVNKDEVFVDCLSKHIYAVLTRNNHKALADELGVGFYGKYEGK